MSDAASPIAVAVLNAAGEELYFSPDFFQHLSSLASECTTPPTPPIADADAAHEGAPSAPGNTGNSPHIEGAPTTSRSPAVGAVGPRPPVEAGQAGRLESVTPAAASVAATDAAANVTVAQFLRQASLGRLPPPFLALWPTNGAELLGAGGGGEGDGSECGFHFSMDKPIWPQVQSLEAGSQDSPSVDTILLSLGERSVRFSIGFHAFSGGAIGQQGRLVRSMSSLRLCKHIFIRRTETPTGQNCPVVHINVPYVQDIILSLRRTSSSCAGYHPDEVTEVRDLGPVSSRAAEGGGNDPPAAVPAAAAAGVRPLPPYSTSIWTNGEVRCVVLAMVRQMLDQQLQVAISATGGNGRPGVEARQAFAAPGEDYSAPDWSSVAVLGLPHRRFAAAIFRAMGEPLPLFSGSTSLRLHIDTTDRDETGAPVTSWIGGMISVEERRRRRQLAEERGREELLRLRREFEELQPVWRRMVDLFLGELRAADLLGGFVEIGAGILENGGGSEEDAAALKRGLERAREVLGRGPARPPAPAGEEQ